VKIHSTAIVDRTAKIAADVAIGPYAVIGARVVIGERSTIESHVVIDPDVTIGSDNVIGPGAIIGTAPQDLSFSSERKTYVTIGNAGHEPFLRSLAAAGCAERTWTAIASGASLGPLLDGCGLPYALSERGPGQPLQ